MVHLWEYDSLAHRQGVRTALGKADRFDIFCSFFVFLGF